MSGSWDKSVEVEANSYNWNDEPIVEMPSVQPNRRRFAHVDLFSGCGGFATGFANAGFSSVFAADIHPPSLETFRFNHPTAVTFLGDIRKLKTSDVPNLIRGTWPALVVTAGVPCQGFSLSNRKRHAHDKRNFLFHEFIRISSVLRPDVVVLENVSGLVSTKDGDFRRDISRAIAELGYEVHFATLNAADFGVPQTRKRVFFVGVPKGASWLFPKGEFGTDARPYRTVREAILGDLPRLSPGKSSSKYSGEPTNEYQEWLRLNGGELLNHQAPNHPRETIERIRATKPGHPMYEAFRQRIRLHADNPSPTQICGGIRPQFQFGHPTQARGLTIRERARIQSFPDDYWFSGGITQGRVQTGNAVPPLLAQAVAGQIIALLSGKSLKGVGSEMTQETLF